MSRLTARGAGVVEHHRYTVGTFIALPDDEVLYPECRVAPECCPIDAPVHHQPTIKPPV